MEPYEIHITGKGGHCEVRMHGRGHDLICGLTSATADILQQVMKENAPEDKVLAEYYEMLKVAFENTEERRDVYIDLAVADAVLQKLQEKAEGKDGDGQ